MDSNTAPSLTYLLTLIVTALVDDEKHVNILTTTEVDRIILRVEVSPNDTGKVIGKMVRTARSIRTIMSAVAMKEKCRVNIDIPDSSLDS